MRRNMELIEAILGIFEGQDKSWAGRPHPPEGIRQDIFDYHLALCEQAGFIAVQRKSGEGQKFQLTWHAHEALEKMSR